MPAARSHVSLALALTAASLAGAPAPAPAGAQMAGLPVLQGAFPRQGLAFAVNGGGGDDGNTFGGAVAWGLAGERLAISGGAGAFRPGTGYESPALTYAGRVAFRLMTVADGRLAVTPFVGLGRVSLHRQPVPATGSDDGGGTRAPIGVSAGFRTALGARGALAFFAAPMYAFSRPDDAAASNDGTFRVAAGAEYGIATGFGSLGVTAGFEVGQSAPAGQFGPRGGAFGFGVALARGRAR